ncbi:MAG: bifunctional (p)ppGpp synthetase/guanosine-3',5'-bis(diphosphate) 3'-pyrophosphohydrolase [Bacilli bacterium]|nr:bifunctional (p)ppGpp synthetase/guanosine-3',5'-bis(diphosphate) 3'-pyrophosphohydrolase [Bacilli bacterium]
MDNKLEIDNISELLEAVKEYIDDKNVLDTIQKAYDYASVIHKNDIRLSGESYMRHPLNVAYILTKLNADPDTICAALLHDTIYIGNATLEEIKEKFGDDIADLVNGITKINKLNLSADTEDHINYYKKIIVGLSEDVRIIIIKLAERCQNMRTLWAIPEDKRREKSKETLEILVPIAHRLGLGELKTELEVLSLKYYKPNEFISVEEQLDNTEEERNEIVNNMIKEVSNILDANNIEYEIKGRAKSIYSIYNKLSKGKKFSEIYDLYALRILVNTVPECYQVMGIIHAAFKPMPKRIKDYIANPKTNMYQSIHTTVFGPFDKLYEIQIRTYEMDKIAERGIASHWSYKEKGKGLQDSMEQKLQMFRNIMEINEENESANDFVSTVKNEVLGNSIYVYTPRGDVFELPKGSTPIDFAYRVHTGVGEKMVGALINDSIAKLDQELESGDIVKIITNKNATPSIEWINMAKTSQAKSKIKAYFTKMDKVEAITKGKDLFLKEIRRRKGSINDVMDKLDVILSSLKLENEDELYYSIGVGKYTSIQTVNIAFKEEESKEDFVLDKILNKQSNNEDYKNDILVSGIADIKIILAKGCKPIKGDPIVGYISRGQGVIVHHKECKNMKHDTERIIDVKWNENTNRKYETLVNIIAINKENTLVDIINTASSNNISVSKVNTVYNQDTNTYELTIKVSDLDTLNKFFANLKRNSDIKSVERVFV